MKGEIYYFYTIGPSVIAGLIVLILLAPINGWIGAKIQAYNVEQMRHKDQRVKLLTELLSGIKVYYIDLRL